MVVIGTSLGGLTALEILLARLPAGFPVPVAVVQHRDIRSHSLTMILQRSTRLRVREPQDKDPFAAGTVYLAPPDYHLLVEADSYALSTEAPVCHARPSIDVLFESAADAFSRSVIGVILTGASSDGAQGAAALKRAGGYLIVQEPTSAECGAMPAAALAATQADQVLPLSDIAAALINLCVRGGGTGGS
jgi:two-component system chemotaxis response regulator CheB